MKATPELLQQALRVLEIGLSPEISAKILATVRLLDEKGAEANLMDFALIEACYTEKIEPESKVEEKGCDISKIDVGYTIELMNGKTHRIKDGDIIPSKEADKDVNERTIMICFSQYDYGYYYKNGKCKSFHFMNNETVKPESQLSDYDIVLMFKS